MRIKKNLQRFIDYKLIGTLTWTGIPLSVVCFAQRVRVRWVGGREGGFTVYGGGKYAALILEPGSTTEYFAVTDQSSSSSAAVKPTQPINRNICRTKSNYRTYPVRIYRVMNQTRLPSFLCPVPDLVLVTEGASPHITGVKVYASRLGSLYHFISYCSVLASRSQHT